MIKLQKGCLVETGYNLGEVPKSSALFTTGNGYMGIRGSSEEFGETRIQGAYIRGLIDEYTEIVQPFADNIYMKKYYFNEQALKDYEKQDCCINFADILTVRFKVGENTFYPWEGNVVSWKRSLNPKTGVLSRTVDWDDGLGNVTRFEYNRFASYENQHVYVMNASATPLNHNLDIEIISGVDTKVRTGGQHIPQFVSKNVNKSDVSYKILSGKKYAYEVGLTLHTDFYADGRKIEDVKGYDNEGILGSVNTFKNVKSARAEKIIFVNTSRDHDEEVLSYAEKGIKNYIGKTYDQLFDLHYEAWKVVFEKFNIEITGDDKANDAVAFTNYQTIISGDPKSHVHSFSAKALSGEQYNQFVWWDSEIYQVPVFIYTMPEVAKNDLLFRYNQLKDAKNNAKAEGYKGARYPFVASVDGKDKVWTYIRHPRYQVHITADVGYAVVNYTEITNDIDFLKDYGMEMLTEILRYWVSRAEKVNGRYEIRNVTGTDEHHPYVHNDAYTNYLVKLIFDRYIDYTNKYFNDKKYVDEDEFNEFKDFADNLYLPMEETGLVPQFDGYFDLSRGLQVEGGSNGGFQMKQAGLYHLSQVIKQPDVMLLYSYVDCFTEKDHYALNWDYYESMCEASSSLTAPVHAICSADNGRFLSFYNYYMKTVLVDIEDLYNCSWQGIHSGCEAGGYYCMLRGVFGVRFHNGELIIKPNPVPFWKKVKMQFVYRGVTVKCTLTYKKLTLETTGLVKATVMGKKVELNGKKNFKVND